MNKVIVIGGGASGLMAAIEASKTSHVTILEKQKRIGTKILVTGNGRCNFSNMVLNTDCYLSNDKSFLEAAFKLFDNNATLNFFNEIGLPYREKNGYLYPYSLQASAVLEAFRNKISNKNIDVKCECNIIRVYKDKKRFVICSNYDDIIADKIIIATGSLAGVKFEYLETGYPIARQLGHEIVDIKPALTYLTTDNKQLKIASGVRFPVEIGLFINNEEKAHEIGELQITNRGISGICVFQLSRFVSSSQEKNIKCIIDFLPDWEFDHLIEFLVKKIDSNSNINYEELFNGILPKKLIHALCKSEGISISDFALVNSKSFHKLINTIKMFKLNITGTGEFYEAQCCMGGIKTEDINPITMESKICSGLYFCGEIIDVDGKCGGYNLQWAWTSGYIAGKNASE